MGDFLPQFANLPLTVIGFLFAMTVIVGIHEYGHYIVGRWCGIKAEVFSIGMGPKVWGRMDKHGTYWQIAALPLGGYVRFKGDANAASVGSDGIVYDDSRSTMNGAPLWARSLTVLAGPVFNFILTIVLYAGLFMAIGKVSMPHTVEKIAPLPAEYGITLQAGDELMRVAGYEFGDVLTEDLQPVPSLRYLVMRDGVEMEVEGPYLFPPLVMSIVPNFPAHQAGFQLGDFILSVNSVPVYGIGEVIKYVSASQGTPLTFKIWREGETFERVISPRMMDLPNQEGGFTREWKIGLSAGPAVSYEMGFVGPFEALSGALRAFQNLLSMTFNTISSLVTGEIKAADNLQGMVGMAQSTGMVVEQGIADYIGWIAVLSASIGLLNLFPIPMLDGGHLVFYVYEAITGRRVPDKLAWLLTTIGLALVVSLMLYALSLDISRLFSWGK